MEIARGLDVPGDVELLSRNGITNRDGPSAEDANLLRIVDDECRVLVLHSLIAPFIVRVDETELCTVALAVEASIDGLLSVTENDLGLCRVIGREVEGAGVVAIERLSSDEDTGKGVDGNASIDG